MNKPKNITRYLILLPFLAVSLIFNPPNTYGYGSDKGRLLASDFGDLYLYDRDGKGRNKASINTGGRAIMPSWSPDGKKVTYTGGNFPEEKTDIFIAKIDGSETINLTNTPDKFEIASLFSPDGRYLRYLSYHSSGSTEESVTIVRDIQNNTELEMPVALSNPDGPKLEGMPYIFQPWSPDSSKLIIQSFDTGSSAPFDYYIVNNDGSDVVKITHNLPEYWYTGSITWLSNSEVLLQEFGDGDGNLNRFIIYNVNTQESSEVEIGNLGSMIMLFMAEQNKLVFSGSTMPALAKYKSTKIYTSSYDPSSKSFSNPEDISTSVICANAPEPCVSMSSPHFFISDSSIAFWGARKLDESNYKIFAFVYKSGEYTKFAEETVDYSAIEIAFSALTYFNNFEPVFAQPVSAPPGLNPNPPKTGKLIGATIFTVSLFAVLALLLKEFKSRNLTQERS